MLYKDTYHLKQLEKSDLNAVKELFWNVFNKKVTLPYLEHKYNTSYLGIQYTCSIAYYGSIPVAFYGAIPQKFSQNNREIYGAHACDSYTLREHQRKGLHFELAKLAYKIMIENGIKFVYAYHSKNTYLSTKKLGWKEHRPMLRFHVKVPTIPISKVVNKLNWNILYLPFFSKNTSQNAIEKLTLEHKDQFTQAFTTDFINYKNSFKNHYCITIEACVFWVKIEAVMHVGLCYAPSEIMLQKAVKKIKRKLFFLGITEVLFQVDANSIIAKQLRSIIEPKASWLVGYLDFNPEIELNDFIFTYSDLDTF